VSLTPTTARRLWLAGEWHSCSPSSVYSAGGPVTSGTVPLASTWRLPSYGSSTVRTPRSAAAGSLLS
jgi:hypothetical protein